MVGSEIIVLLLWFRVGSGARFTDIREPVAGRMCGAPAIRIAARDRIEG
jgi:hypothetical protein